MDVRASRKRLVMQAVVHFYACFTKVCLGASYSSVTFTVEPKGEIEIVLGDEEIQGKKEGVVLLCF